MGVQYYWTTLEDDADLFAFPDSESLAQTDSDETCHFAGANDALAWDKTNGRFWIEGIEEGRDGCHFITFNEEAATTTGWWLCAPIDALTPLMSTDGAEVQVNIDNSYASGQARGLRVSVSHHQADMITAQMTMYFIRGADIPSELSLALEPSRIEGCKGRLGPCGEIEIPQRMETQTTNGNETLTVGQTLSVGSGLFRRDITLVRAAHKAVANQTCGASEAAPLVQAGSYVEAIVTLYTP